MKNPLDTVKGTLWAGFILTAVLWFIVDVIIFPYPAANTSRGAACCAPRLKSLPPGHAAILATRESAG